MSLNVYPNLHTCDKTPNVLWVYFCHFHTFSRIPASQPETEIQVRLLKNVETTSFYFLLSGPSFGKCPQDISKTFDNYDSDQHKHVHFEGGICFKAHLNTVAFQSLAFAVWSCEIGAVFKSLWKALNTGPSIIYNHTKMGKQECSLQDTARISSTFIIPCQGVQCPLLGATHCEGWGSERRLSRGKHWESIRLNEKKTHKQRLLR